LARQRWGSKGMISSRVDKKTGSKVFQVGTYEGDFIPMFFVLGQGVSWSEAFDKARQARLDERKRYTDLYQSKHGADPVAEGKMGPEDKDPELIN
jgi:hypothetical protein